ncbi:phage tail family protein [Fusibacter ferrireducens]|uniref:Tail tape measure protein n=1 Tax=Fusibacter ferrireducens TaxID=2785058 RepID=A0ABR9ZV84_9FIRM|nr:hypothetical protein [Fusibacter ferrireducens]MBF4693901.1 hypothetical protein [Fusibacter ferrireducens]
MDDMIQAINSNKKAYISAMAKENSATERLNKTLDKTIKKLNVMKALMLSTEVVLVVDATPVNKAAVQVKKAGEEVEKLKWTSIGLFVKMQTGFRQVGFEAEKLGWSALDLFTKIKLGIKLFDGKKIALNLKDRTTTGLKKVWHGIQKINDKRIEIKATIKDNVLRKMDAAILKVKELKSKVKDKILLAFDMKAGVLPKLKSIGKAISPLRKTVNIVIKAKDKTQKSLGNIGKKLKKFVLGGIGKLAVAGLKKAVDIAGISLNNAINKQAKKTGIEAIVSQNNNGMSEKDVKAKSDAYMKSLKANSNKSVYSEGEVLDAGSSALKMAKGDTGEAEKFLKLAEDMAGSNSGKTLMEAMDALTEAQSGNLDALKAFGVNATEESLKNAGGNILNMKNDSGSTMTEQFKGGAEAAGKTIPGQIAKLKGIGETILTDIASTSLDGISGILGKGVEFLSANQEKFTQFGLTISRVVGDAFNFIFRAIQSLKPIVDTFMGFILSKKDVFMEMFGNIMGIVDQFKAAWVEAWPVIQDMLAGVWEMIEPILSVWINYISALIGFIAQVARIAIKVFVGVVLPVIKRVFDFIQPIATRIIGYVLSFYEGIIGLYNLITDFLKNIFKEDIPERTTSNKAENAGSVDMITGASPMGQTFMGTTTENLDLVNLGAKNAFSMTNMPGDKAVLGEIQDASYVSYSKYAKDINQEKIAITPNDYNSFGSNKNSNPITITIPKLADNISVSDSKDVEKLLSRLEEKLMSVALNMGVV